MDLMAVSQEDQILLRRNPARGISCLRTKGIVFVQREGEWMPSFEGSLIHGESISIPDANRTFRGFVCRGDASCTPEHGTWSITGSNLTLLLCLRRTGRSIWSRICRKRVLRGFRQDR